MAGLTKGRIAGLALVAAAAFPSLGYAADSYWDQQCTNGGWTFNTCASAHVTVTGNTVTIRIWNLAGIPGSSTFANTGFTAIGLSSLGSGLSYQNLQAFYSNGTSYSGWSFSNGGGGIPGPVGSNGVVINGAGSAIYSQYATAPLPGGATSLNQTNWAGAGQFGSGFVKFTFTVWNQVCTGNGNNRVCNYTPASISLSNAVLGLHAQSGPAGQSTGYECAATSPTGSSIPYPCNPPSTDLTPVPEPATMALMAIGLVGMAGAGVARRRKQNRQS